MGRVRRLPDVLINQIAAGEAVERPASVVKELLENALDAGAGSLDVEVEGGGRRSIRVADDGCGMSPGDARLALERHATSKLSALEDLAAIRTLGFRGEALPAIASVSRLTLRTAATEGEGFRIEVEGGTTRAERPDPHPRGTSVEVRDLFFNTPARAKFLRTASTELARISETVQACALSHPGARVRLRHQGRELLSAPPSSDLRERVGRVFGRDLAGSLLPLAAGAPPLTVDGFVSGPGFSRASRAQWFLFVNGRLVADRSVAHAVSEACRRHFPRDRFPALFLFLELPPEAVDVNVHPAKREVRFRTPGAVHRLVRGAVEQALASMRPGAEPAAAGRRPEAVAEAVEDYLARVRSPAPPAARRSMIVPSTAVRSGPGLPAGGPTVRVVGQLRDTYIVVEEEAGLLLVDQHAAHERLLYDRYREDLRAGDPAAQALLFPVTVELDAAAAPRLRALGRRLAGLGFALEPFGGDGFVVREVPARLASLDPASFLRDLAAGEAEADEAIEALHHRVAALAACHAAVRAGMRLDVDRMHRLVVDLLARDHAPTCPHGRPATLRKPLRELERAFLRP